MANNYCEFSFMIEDLTKEEQAWINGLTDNEYYNLFEEDDEFYDLSGPDFEWDVSSNGWWINSGGGYGNAEHVTIVLQKFLQLFRPNKKIGFSWAYYCSKLRCDEQGGGAAVVSATDDEWIDTWYWIMKRMEA